MHRRSSVVSWVSSQFESGILKLGQFMSWNSTLLITIAILLYLNHSNNGIVFFRIEANNPLEFYKMNIYCLNISNTTSSLKEKPFSFDFNALISFDKTVCFFFFILACWWISMSSRNFVKRAHLETNSKKIYCTEKRMISSILLPDVFISSILLDFYGLVFLWSSLVLIYFPFCFVWYL